MANPELQALLIPAAAWVTCVCPTLVTSPPGISATRRSFACGIPMTAAGWVAALAFLAQIAHGIQGPYSESQATTIQDALHMAFGLNLLATSVLLGTMPIQQRLVSSLSFDPDLRTMSILFLALPGMGTLIQGTVIYNMGGII